MSICLHEIDPELSASTGLTNDVCGRLAIFSAPVDDDDAQSNNEDCASALATPSKNGDASDDETHAVDEEQQIYASRDEYLHTLQNKSTQEQKMCIGERLYYLIANEYPESAGKLTGMFLEATDSVEDLALLLYSPSSLKLLLSQALDVLSAARQSEHICQSPTHAKPSQTRSEPSPTNSCSNSPDALGFKRSYPQGGARQYPSNGKKARVDTSRPFFAEITDDSGKRTRVPCRYDTVSRMYVPSGGRDTVPCGKKVGTRDKTPQDLQALELGETDECKLRARQKQINIGRKTEGYRRLMALGLSGRALQDALSLPYMTEDGTLALSLVCSKKRYDGYLRIWKRKLYEFAGLQRLNFSSAAPPAAAPTAAAAPAPAQAASHASSAASEPATPPAATRPAAGSWAARVAGAGAAAGRAGACR